MRNWLSVFVELYDNNVCSDWCFPFFVRCGSKPFCSLEEHEAMHVEWIQAELTFDEWLEVLITLTSRPSVIALTRFSCIRATTLSVTSAVSRTLWSRTAFLVLRSLATLYISIRLTYKMHILSAACSTLYNSTGYRFDDMHLVR